MYYLAISSCFDSFLPAIVFKKENDMVLLFSLSMLVFEATFFDSLLC